MNILAAFWLILFKTTLQQQVCGDYDFITAIGGYPQFHALEHLEIDVHPSTGDLLIGGSMQASTQPLILPTAVFAFVNNQQNCRIEWSFILTATRVSAVKSVAFDTYSSRVYALTWRELTKIQLVWVENEYPERVEEMHELTINRGSIPVWASRQRIHVLKDAG